jgi:N-acyl-D-amino-acid deacylase
MFDNVIVGGEVIDGSGLPRFRADVGISGGRIAAIGRLGQAEARTRIDATGKVISPGFIDAHVHGDLMLFADPLHEPAIRQGVTTYILGQDGVAMAPASASVLEYMRRYTAGFSGGAIVPLTPNPSPQRGEGSKMDSSSLKGRGEFLSMDEYLRAFDGRTAINVACLIPNGNVRMEAMGLPTRVPTADELRDMRRRTREAMEQGAVGLSTGLDYIPSRYAEVEELIALCQEIAPFGGVYVTHMRAYDPDRLHWAMDEVFRIGREADVAVHISHFNSQAELAIPKMDAAARAGIDCTFDLYCYLAGSTILGMIALPPWVQEGGVDATVERLRKKETRERLREAFAKPERGPLEEVRLTYLAHADYRRFEGKTLAQASAEAGTTIGEFVCDALAACNMAVGCVVPHRRRGEADVQALMRDRRMMAGSDGIYVGSRPHPRGCGCFARYLGHYVRDAKVWSLEEAISKLAYHAARRYRLKDRGLLHEGMAADVVVLDPATIRDRATYDDGRLLAEGVSDVLVNGQLVLHGGARTKATPGRGLRRG